MKHAQCRLAIAYEAKSASLVFLAAGPCLSHPTRTPTQLQPNPSTHTASAPTDRTGAPVLSPAPTRRAAGEGLGRNRQGIAKPIEVTMRPKGMALGFGDREEPKLGPPQPDTQQAASDKERRDQDKDGKVQRSAQGGKGRGVVCVANCWPAGLPWPVPCACAPCALCATCDREGSLCI